MRLLAIIATILGLFISTSAGSAGNSRTELERAIASLATRAGPPETADKELQLLPPGLIQHSLWQMLTSRFEFADLEHPDIDSQIEYFRGGLYSLKNNLTRAQPFLYFIADELDRAGLPLDLAMLPLVESAFDPHAHSAQHALGIWQFIPSTAKLFDLPVGNGYDGRKDVVASTRAAISYLQKLNDTFDGDWLLALAAYNTGPSNVRAAMAKAEKRGETPEFWNLRLAKETRNYVPRILAATRMIMRAEEYGLVLPAISNRKAIESIAVGRPLAFAQVAAIVGETVDTIAALNPGHTNREIPVGGPYQIVVPAAKADLLLTALEEDKLGPVEPVLASNGVAVPIPGAEVKYQVVPDAYLPETSREQQFKPYKKYVYQSHVVARGDNLWKISRQMETDMDTMLDWNGRSDKLLQPGDKLIVAYLRDETTEDPTPRLLNYRVHAHDTLVTISDKFDLSISDIKKWNPVLWESNHVRAGQSLRIPAATNSDL